MAPTECRWVEDDEGVWDTDCDNKFVFIDSGPKENHMEFCCYCGRPLRAKPAGDMNEPPEPDGESFQGREAEGFERETQADIMRDLKR